MIDVLSHEDMQEKMVRKLETDYTGRTLNLGELSGIKHKELIAYPGELVTLFGPTGVNKTTYAQNLVLGFDAINEEVRKELQIETLWLSLELSPEMMHRRNIQIAGNFTPEEVKDDPVGTYNQVKDKLNHVVIQTVSPTMEQILEKIRSMNPALIVVDYVELVEPPKYVRGEYEQLNKIAHGLRNMAVNEDVIILLISQISRENARKDNLDIYSAKGSGAMENASAKVMGIHGKQEERYREVELYKNSDGDLFGVALEFQPSYRLTRTTRRVRL